MTLFTLVLQAAALTVVFVRGSIFASLRSHGPAIWREFAACPLCVGVWVGAGWRLLHGAGTVSAEDGVEALACGALTGVLALIVSLFIAVLDKHS